MKYKGFYAQLLHDCFQTYKSLLTFAKTWQSNTQAKKSAYFTNEIEMTLLPKRHASVTALSVERQASFAQYVSS